MKKQMLNKNGITLVALVITIVILLILSSITIATLTQTGLFGKAKLAQQKSENAQLEENETLTDYEDKISKYINNSRNNTETNYDENSYDCWKTWIYLAGENPNLYKSSEILNNEELMQKVTSNKKAMNYLINSKTFIMPIAINNETVKKKIKLNAIHIPNMTSDTTPAGEAKASCNYEGGSPYGAFTGFWNDENIEKYGKNENYSDAKNHKVWTTPNNATTYPSWLQYKFENQKIQPLLFEYMSSYSWGYGCVHKIKIQGSNNETDWKDLTEEIECQPFTKYELAPTKNIDEYQYFRLNVLSRTETWGSRTDVFLFQVYGYEK